MVVTLDVRSYKNISMKPKYCVVLQFKTYKLIFNALCPKTAKLFSPPISTLSMGCKKERETGKLILEVKMLDKQ